MIFWSLVVTTGWALCVLLMLVIIKGGHMTRGHEKNRHSRFIAKTQKEVKRSLDYAASM